MAVEEGTFTGTHLGAARTGRTVALEYVQVLRFRYSKCVSLTLTFDRLVMLEQLGLTAGDEHIGTAATAGDPSELVDESGR